MTLQEGNVVNLDAILKRSKIKDRINRVGIEVEGGWSELPDGTEPVRDGSIRNLAFNDRPLTTALREMLDHEGNLTIHVPGRPSPLKVGEIPSDPLERYKISTWMKKYYPQHINETCGLHVHMSFKTAMHYQKLMTIAYPKTVIAYMYKWATAEKLPKDHVIWGRLEGTSPYCQHAYYAQEQAQLMHKDYDRTRRGHRYTVMNYCYTRHNTIECRLLPMFKTADQGIKAVNQILDITNAFLVATAAREEKFVIDVEDPIFQQVERDVREEFV